MSATEIYTEGLLLSVTPMRAIIDLVKKKDGSG